MEPPDPDGTAGAAVVALLAVVPSARFDVTVTATVDHWSDGDTVVTDLGTIRLIGVNAPDIGACGYAKATKLAGALAPAGATVTLTLPDAHDDTDDYGRLLRYVAVELPGGAERQAGRYTTTRTAPTGGGSVHPALGISVAPVSTEMAAQSRLTTPVRGVLVSDVIPGGPSEDKLFRDDVITEVLYPAPARAISTPADLQAALGRLKNGDYVSLKVFSLRDATHATRIVNLQVGK